MTTQRTVLAIALVFTIFFAFLTLSDAIRNGVSFLTVVSLAVLALFGIGIVGALWQPPEE
jgi:hypothetical protein